MNVGLPTFNRVFGKDGIVGGDTEGMIVHASGGAQELLGTSRFDVLEESNNGNLVILDEGLETLIM